MVLFSKMADKIKLYPLALEMVFKIILEYSVIFTKLSERVGISSCLKVFNLAGPLRKTALHLNVPKSSYGIICEVR